MISRIVSIIAGFYLVIIFTFSCTSDIKKESPSSASSDSLTTNDSPVSNNSATQNDSQVSNSKISPFTLEDAESLAGKYYNQQNQLKKYPYYKSIEIEKINIDSNYRKDTIHLTAHTSGRIWLNPNKDTITSFFSQDLALKVYRYKQIWWADKLQSPESVNDIPLPVKK